MAKAKESAEKVEEGKKPGKSKLLLIILIIVVVVAGGGAGAWFFLKPKHGAEEVHEKPKPKPPVFQKLDTFTVNLAGGDERYLQVEISLKIADSKVGEQITQLMPEIRDRVLRLLSSKKADELATPEGKNKLSEEIRAQLNQLLGIKSPDDGVRGVLFTSFIIQ